MSHSPLELVVIMPVYNEEDAVKGVLFDWLRMLDALGIEYALHIYNDGSTDGTADAVQEVVRAHSRVIFHDRKENRGHGPTILAAYREHLDVPWIFQTDSDGEIGPEHFPEMWEQREGYDLLLGYRTGRKSPPIRKLATWGARTLIKCCFGGTIKDVNVPYRLMRSETLSNIIQAIPDDTFAPNVLVCGVMARLGGRTFQLPVKWLPRTNGIPSLVGLACVQPLGRAFWQTVRLLHQLGRILGKI